MSIQAWWKLLPQVEAQYVRSSVPSPASWEMWTTPSALTAPAYISARCSPWYGACCSLHQTGPGHGVGGRKLIELPTATVCSSGRHERPGRSPISRSPTELGKRTNSTFSQSPSPKGATSATVVEQSSLRLILGAIVLPGDG